jgi:hypothetical protein
VRVVPPVPRQGDVVVLFVGGTHGAREVEGSIGARHLAFFPYGAEYAALAGVDVETKPGKLAWHIGLVDGGGTPRKAAGTVTVKAGRFAVQRLTLPKSMVDLDPETERRATNEAVRLRALFDSATPERLWRGSFTRPVAGPKPGEGFGSRRIINGQPRMPHTGVDFAADRGTPIVASNRGKVALLGDFFFAGRLVVLDHGLGLLPPGRGHGHGGADRRARPDPGDGGDDRPLHRPPSALRGPARPGARQPARPLRAPDPGLNSRPALPTTRRRARPGARVRGRA